MNNFIKYQEEKYLLTREELDQLIQIFENLAEVSAKGDEAVIIVQSRLILKNIIESAIERYQKNQNNEDKKE